MTWDGTHEDAMMRCGFVLENGDYCQARTRMKYPGNDPENGAAREYCPSGHSTCYKCGEWFQAIEPIEGWTDEETGQVIPPSSTEGDWCTPCAEQRMKDFCGCGSVPTHHHYGCGCCGSEICCVAEEET